MMTYLQIFADKVKLLEPFDDAERGRLLTAMMSYAFDGVDPVLTGNERYIWPVFRDMIDQSRKNLDNKRRAGSVKQDAAEPSTTEQDGAEPSTTEQDEANDHINQESRIKNQESRTKNQREDTGARAKRFTPPTTDEVSAYAKEHGLTLDANRFCDFYASKGWKVGNTPMKDWRAAVRNWAGKDKSPPFVAAPHVKQVEQQQYSQRPYVHSDDAMDRMMAEHMAVQAGGTS